MTLPNYDAWKLDTPEYLEEDSRCPDCDSPLDENSYCPECETDYRINEPDPDRYRE